MRVHTPILAGTLIAAFACGPLRAQSPVDNDPAIARQVAILVNNLDSDDFTTRQRATEELKSIGAPAVEPLVAATTRGSLEVAVRAIDILEAIYVASDRARKDDIVDMTELALERLKDSKNPSLGGRANSVLDAHYSIRQRRAITEIHRLGGVARADNSKEIDPAHEDAGSAEFAIQGHVQLDENWTGGDEGLKHLRRMYRLPLLYLVEGVNISKESVERLEEALPLLRIEYRPRVRFGITGSPDPRIKGCMIIDVMPNSAAAKAGVQPQDILTEFDGKPVDSFDGLVDLLKKGGYNPGDKAKAKLIRNSHTMTVDVVLGGWN